MGRKKLLRLGGGKKFSTYDLWIRTVLGEQAKTVSQKSQEPNNIPFSVFFYKKNKKENILFFLFLLSLFPWKSLPTELKPIKRQCCVVLLSERSNGDECRFKNGDFQTAELFFSAENGVIPFYSRFGTQTSFLVFVFVFRGYT